MFITIQIKNFVYVSITTMLPLQGVVIEIDAVNLYIKTILGCDR